MKKVLDAALVPMKEKEAELAGYHLEITDDAYLKDDPKQLPEINEEISNYAS
jgi:hypothetical protein